MVCSVCQWFGVAIDTTSMSLLSSIWRKSVYTVGFLTPLDSSPFIFAPMWLSSTSHRPAISTFFIPAHALTWLPPRPPSPAMPTRTVSFGLCMPRTAALPAMMAVLMRKWRRFMVTPSNGRRARSRGRAGQRGDSPTAGGHRRQHQPAAALRLACSVHSLRAGPSTRLLRALAQGRPFDSPAPCARSGQALRLACSVRSLRAGPRSSEDALPCVQSVGVVF